MRGDGWRGGESRKGGRGMREWLVECLVLLGEVLAGLVLVGALWGGWQFLTRLPVVHRSWSTQECVEVFSKNPAYDCRNLPPKYSNVWVQ